MKELTKKIGILSGLFLISSGSLSAQCNAAGSHFTENFSSSAGWTFIDPNVLEGPVSYNCTAASGPVGNGSVNISSNALNFVTARGPEIRAYRSIPTVSNDHWTVDFTFTLNNPPAGALASNQPSFPLLGLSDGSGPIGAVSGGSNGIFATLHTPTTGVPGTCTGGQNQTTWYFQASSFNGGTGSFSNPIFLTSATTYYLRLQRTWHSSGVLTVYTDAGHTNILGSPVCFGISPSLTNLNYMQHGISYNASVTGAQDKILNASISNVRIDNDVTCPLSLTPSFTINSSFCLGDPITANGTASTGTPMQEGAYFWAIAECSSTGVIVPGTEWSQWYTGQAGSYTFPTVANGGPNIQCNKYYSVKLAIQNCGNVWAETSNVIVVRCSPKMVYLEPEPICMGTSNTLSVAGASLSYAWSPATGLSATTGASVTANPTTTTTYTVIGTNSYGCTATATMTQVVAPALLDINISTGVNNINGTQFNPGSSVMDDTWKRRGIPGSVFTGAYSSLGSPYVVTPNASYDAWYNNAAIRWLAPFVPQTGFGTYYPTESTVSQTDLTSIYNNHYWYETQFDLLMPYSNLRIEGTHAGADNNMTLYLNSDALTSNSPTNNEYSLTGSASSNFNTNHNPGTFATNQSHYNLGTNTILISVQNNPNSSGGPSYTGFFINARVKGTCGVVQMPLVNELKNETLNTIEESIEGIEVFPSPNNGMFTVTSTMSNLQHLMVTDVTGRMVREIKNLNANRTDVDLSDQDAGIYLVKAWIEGNIKPIVKKVIVNK